MTRTSVALSLAAAFALAVSLGAQTTSTQSRSSATSEKDNVNVTGCLQKDASGAYILANAQIDTSAGRTSSTEAPPSTATGTTGTSSPAATWKLAGDTADLDKHVGHKVTVTGKEIASTSSSASSTTSTGTTGTSTTATGTTAAGEAQKMKSESDSAKKLEVKSVKMISSSCS